MKWHNITCINSNCWCLLFKILALMVCLKLQSNLRTEGKTHSFAITKVIFQYIHPSIESDCPPSVRPIVCLFVTKNTSEYKWMDFRVKGV